METCLHSIVSLIISLATIAVLHTCIAYLDTYNHEFGHFKKLNKYTKGKETIVIRVKSMFRHVTYIEDYNLLIIANPKASGFTQSESNFQFARNLENGSDIIKEISMGGIQEGRRYFVRQAIKSLAIILAALCAFNSVQQYGDALLLAWFSTNAGHVIYRIRYLRKAKKTQTGWNDYMVHDNPDGFIEFMISDENKDKFEDIVSPYETQTGWPQNKNFTYYYFRYLCRINSLKKVVATK